MSMSFGFALAALKDSARVTRKVWDNDGIWLELQTPSKHGRMALPCICMRTAQGDLVPWLASQISILADDWSIVD